MSRPAAALSFALVLALGAISQPKAQERVVLAQERSERPVRVQVGTSFFMPGPVGDLAEANRVREQARRVIYEMAAKECEVLLSVFASQCRLEGLNVNVARQGGQQVDGFIVNGSMTYSVTMK
jgi:hypothetical protein